MFLNRKIHAIYSSYICYNMVCKIQRVGRPSVTMCVTGQLMGNNREFRELTSKMINLYNTIFIT